MVRRILMVLLAMAMAVAACGGDDGTEAATTTTRPRPDAAQWRALDERVDGLADHAALLAVEVADDGSLTPVHEHRPAQIGPLGSIFKLYVLGALVTAVHDGTLGWDDPVTIEAGDVSLAGGLETQTGATLTIRRAATLMIANSDNTAADAILRLVGRPAVEAMLEPMGMGQASRAKTLPFLTAREAFIVKWGPHAAQYARADTAGRRAILHHLPDPVPNPFEVDITQPAEVDRVEWFATPQEIAAAHLWLDRERAQPDGAALQEVLTSGNPGLALLDAATWAGGAFKGGSEPGVLSLSWRLERKDGHRFLLAIMWSSADRNVDNDEGRAISLAAIDLLAKA
jgi:hypothetical protein